MDDEVRQRLRWIKLYQRTSDAGLVCRRCGISRPILRKWLRRYEQLGNDGLKSQSRRPKHSPGRKALAQQEQWILDLRRDRNLGVRRIQNELKHLNGKVERVQKTDLQEFYSVIASEIDISNRNREELDMPLAEWQHYYNWERVHGSIGKAPIDKWFELMYNTPLHEEVSAEFDPTKEAARIRSYNGTKVR